MNKCCEKWKVAYYQGEAESGLHGKRVEYKIHQIVPEFCPECGRKLESGWCGCQTWEPGKAIPVKDPISCECIKCGKPIRFPKPKKELPEKFKSYDFVENRQIQAMQKIDAIIDYLKRVLP